ncbi:helix-turn-helix transcriptional regulator [Ochrobactrum sp. XJ1]|nr:helix-turn-helix transcriptional regulator [Ochrobactrum sp. XJ1]
MITDTFQDALVTAGVNLVRSLKVSDSIEIKEWCGLHTLTEYSSSSRNVLSVYMNGGENCSLISNRKVVKRGFHDAICLFPTSTGDSAWRIDGKLNFLHLYFDTDFLHEVVRDAVPYSARRIILKEVFQESCDIVSSAAESIYRADWNKTDHALGVDGIVNWIILNIIREYSEIKFGDNNRNQKFNERQRRILEDYMKTNLSDAVRLEQICKTVNLSQFHFMRKFKNTYGTSPYAFLRRLRMDYAKKLILNTDMKILSVALECGYGHHAHFSTAFREHFGVSPKKLREERL